MNKVFKKLPLSKSFYIFASVILLLAITILSFVLYYSLMNEDRRVSKELVFESQIAAKTISQFVKERTNLTEFMARKIEDVPNDLEFIQLLFKRKFALDISLSQENLFHWPTFKWVNAKGYVEVTSKEGIIKNPSERHLIPSHYVNTKDYWHPIFGDKTQDKQISINMMLTDDSHSHLGSIVTYLDIDTLMSRIKSGLRNTNVHFILLDKNNNIIDQSFEPSLTENFFKYKIGNIDFDAYPNGELPRNIEVGNHIFLSYGAISNAPFKIIMGGDKDSIYANFYEKLVNWLLVIFISMLFITSTLYMMYKITIKPVKDINKAGQQILKTGECLIAPPKNASKEVIQLWGILQRFKRQKHQFKNTNDELKEKTQELILTKQELEDTLNNIEESEVKRQMHLACIQQNIKGTVDNGLSCIKGLKDALEHPNSINSNQVADILGIIGDNLFSVKTGISKVSREGEFNFLEAITDCKKILYKDLRKYNLDMSISNHSSRHIIPGDSACFKQLLLSILSFQIKFVIDSVIDVSVTEIVKEGNQWIKLSIADTGALGVDARMTWETQGEGESAAYFACGVGELETIVNKCGAELEFEDNDSGVTTTIYYPAFDTLGKKDKSEDVLTVESSNVVPLRKK